MQTDTSFTNPLPAGRRPSPSPRSSWPCGTAILSPPRSWNRSSGGCEATPQQLEQLLLREGYCDEKHLQSLRAEAYGWTFIDLQQAFVNDDLLTLIPRSVACEQNVVPFAKTNDVVRVATLQPGNAGLRRLLEKKFGTPVELTLATPSAISGLLKLYDSEFHARVSRLGSPGRGGVASGGQGDDSVVDFVDALLSHGIAEGASDIHIEPHREQAVVRERIDGLLRKSVTFSKKCTNA